MEINDIPINLKVINPWGSEYKIYSNSIRSTKLLRINSDKSTLYTVILLKKQVLFLLKERLRLI